MSQVQDHLSDHEYDGIREYDNPTPGWWHMIFIGSVIFSVFYFFYWTFSPIAPTIQDQWAKANKSAVKRELAAMGDLRNDPEIIMKLVANPDMLKTGRNLFAQTCAACHTKDGGGMIGPNLCDDYYKNAKSITDLYEVITNGAAEGAMPAWKIYSDAERVQLAAYVASLRGTTPAAPKAPEGEVLPPWPAPPAQ